MPRSARPSRAEFTAKERRIVARCRTPHLVQRWLKSLPYNFERRGETLRTFRVVTRLDTAHWVGRIELQVEGRGLDRLLLVAGEPYEAVREGVGDAEPHSAVAIVRRVGVCGAQPRRSCTH